MTAVAVAVVPATPLLSPDVSVTDSGVRDVQAAARSAVASLLEAAPDVVVVLGEAAALGEQEGSWDWHAFGLPRRLPAVRPLPRALAVGAWLLDDAGWTGPRRYVGVPASTAPAACAELGSSLGSESGRLGVLAVADGSARRSLKAPGHLDERAQGFDAGLARALAAADAVALTAIDVELAAELMAAGRAALHVAAELARHENWTGELLCHEAPYGVGWFVARWQQAESS